MTAPTSPKPPTPTDLTVSKDAATTLDNEAADAGLRTALTKLADDWPGGFGEAIRALLAAHPAEVVSDTRREDKARELHGENDDDGATCGVCLGKIDTRREDVALALYIADADGQDEAFLRDIWNRTASQHVVRLHWYRLADAVLAVLPAPPVDDGGWTVADWEEWAGEVASTLPEDCDGDEAQVEIIAKFVRRAATVPVVDEAEIQDIVRDAYDTHIDLGSPARRGEFVFTAAQVSAARLRGATRG